MEETVEPYIDKAEVARRIGKSVRSIDSYMRARIIPFVRLNKHVVLFKWSDIQSHFEQNFRVAPKG
jgi:hypothetical protein